MLSLTVGQVLLFRLAIAALVATTGAAAAVLFKKISHEGLCLLISFAAGALLTVAFLHIIPEVFEQVGKGAGFLSVLTGYLFFYVVSKFIFHVCPACSATHAEVNFRAVTLTMALALSAHSFTDGLAVYSGYLTNPSLGFLVLLGVAFHKFPEGMALALVARGSGMSRPKAFILTSALEWGTTVMGGLVGFALLLPESSWGVGYVLGIVAGGFVFIVFHALLSELMKHHPLSTLLAALGGAFTLAFIGFLTGIF